MQIHNVQSDTDLQQTRREKCRNILLSSGKKKKKKMMKGFSVASFFLLLSVCGNEVAWATSTSKCSLNVHKLASSCAPLLLGLSFNDRMTTEAVSGNSCCGLLSGLLPLELSECLCAALDVNVLGLIDIKVNKLDWAVSLLTTCKRSVPTGFKCT